MSRSRRKRPFVGITTARSEKQDKRRYNRRFRRVTKQWVRVTSEPEVPPELREQSDPWMMDKDGKGRFDPKQRPKWMRK